MSEYMAIDHFGITGPGDSWKAVEGGDLEIDGRIPVNPSGGLIGLGHPVGATGVRMMLDAFKQVNGLAGDYQVDAAQNGCHAEHRRQHDDQRELRRRRRELNRRSNSARKRRNRGVIPWTSRFWAGR